MEAKVICDKEILTEGMGKASVTNLWSNLPAHETDFQSLEYALTVRHSCRLCTGTVG